MQLFITRFDIREKKIVLEEGRINKQIRSVLRMKSGEVFFVQSEDTKDKVVRYKVELDVVNKKEVIANILSKEVCEKTYEGAVLYVALPNKIAKLELICQKLSEL